MARQSMAPVIVARFFTAPKYNHRKSVEEKRAIYDDEEQVELRFGGDTQKVSVFPAHEAEPNATREAQLAGAQGDEGFAIDTNAVVTYAMVFNKEYLAFKNGDAQEANGTPLKLLGLSEGKQRELKALNVYTIEALASLDGPQLKRLGMNARALKTTAEEYLATVAQNTPISGAQLAMVQAENARLRARLDELQTTIPRGETSPIPEPAAPKAPPEKVLSQAEIDEAAAQSMDVKQWSEEDLRAYVTNSTGKEPAKRISRKALEDQAMAIAEG